MIRFKISAALGRSFAWYFRASRAIILTKGDPLALNENWAVIAGPHLYIAAPRPTGLNPKGTNAP